MTKNTINDLPEWQLGYHVVCVVDILGQKDRLAGWADLPEGGVLTDGILDALKSSVGVVLDFKDHYEAYFRSVSESTMPERVAELSKYDRAKYDRVKDCQLQIQQFSDTFVFYSRVPNMYGDLSVTALYRVLGASCFSLLLSLARRTPIRGGICIGAGIEIEEKNFYGPGLAAAHHLESEIAGYPRIVVSEEVRSFVYDEFRYSVESSMNTAMVEMASLCRPLICQDTDGRWIVDWLGPGMRSLHPETSGRFIEAVCMAWEYVRSRAEKYSSEGDSKLGPRYSALQEYIESRLPMWGIEV